MFCPRDLLTRSKMNLSRKDKHTRIRSSCLKLSLEKITAFLKQADFGIGEIEHTRSKVSAGKTAEQSSKWRVCLMLCRVLVKTPPLKLFCSEMFQLRKAKKQKAEPSTIYFSPSHVVTLFKGISGVCTRFLWVASS